MKLKDKICIVTGGASGSGEGVARRYVQEGARVHVSHVAAAIRE